MCGLVGVLGPGAERMTAEVSDAACTIAHRGPDRQTVASGEAWALGFRRLSILDLSPRGDQPMSTRDGRHHLVFNGEVYNYRELRRELEVRGVEVRSDGDAEVVLHWIVREGAAALRRFNGMFALAVVDRQRRTFLLARDRLGVKPLYVRMSGERLDFASELKALLALPGAPREVDRTSLVEYLALGYLSSESCILAGYEKLPPATVMEGSLDRPGEARRRRYWSIDVDGGGRAWEDGELSSLLDDAVAVRLRSDVRVGVFLSGGIDSGLVAASCARMGADVRPVALTVGFPGADRDESRLAEATARHTGLPHRIVAQRSTALEDVDRLAWHFDEPFGDPSALATYALCESAAEHGRVWLSGDGGDEAFGGYRRYLETRRIASRAALASRLGDRVGPLLAVLPATSALRFRLRKATLPDDGFAAFFDIVADDPIVGLVVPPPLRALATRAGRPVWDRWARSHGRSITDRQRALDYSLYLTDDVLVKVDRASMASSVEVRSPMLDYRIVERAATVPADSLFSDGGGKQPLRRLANEQLPSAVAAARKRGFGIPVDEWFGAESGQAFLRERLLDPDALQHGLWDPAGVEAVMRAHLRPGGRQFGTLLWRLTMLEAWSRNFLGAAVPSGTQRRVEVRR
jgi:asparagine synthase (glutamine-hydrolysing)